MAEKRQDVQPYPLKCVPRALEKVWGGEKIAHKYYPRFANRPSLGEVWAVWGQLAVENGAWSGQLVDDLVRAYPRAILGSRLAKQPINTFPLLVKILEARQTLSVQVHPDDTYAQNHEGEPFGKSEVWYILDTEPGASLLHGLQEPTTQPEIRHAIENGTFQDRLASVEVKAGDVVLNPPGTIHAVGEGILLYELQQSSDLTYRFYDWDRRDPNRPLHIEKSLDVADLAPYPAHTIEPIQIQDQGSRRSFLCATRHFVLELLEIETAHCERPAGKGFHILTVLAGQGEIQTATPSLSLPLHCGDSLLVPADVPEYTIRASDSLCVAKAYVPDLKQDIVEPLLAHGLLPAQIQQLGGNPRHSELGPLLTI